MKPHPKDRFEAIGNEIRAAQSNLEQDASNDWSTGIGGLLNGLSHELDSIGPDHDEPHDEVHGKFDSIERRLGEVKDRMGAKQGHPV
ncbi:hypothetical protein [Amaricoccus macauensis]|uniref:hypothetical protein n=1 Tax=Amaricoccus macauensis TaxID=57001 RepID=UPI003C7A0A4A